MTPAEAATKIRAAKDVAVLIRAPSGDYDVVDVTPEGAAALRKIGPQWVLGVYQIVGGVPTREAPVASAPAPVVPIGRRRDDRRTRPPPPAQTPPPPPALWPPRQK